MGNCNRDRNRNFNPSPKPKIQSKPNPNPKDKGDDEMLRQLFPEGWQPGYVFTSSGWEPPPKPQKEMSLLDPIGSIGMVTDMVTDAAASVPWYKASLNPLSKKVDQFEITVDENDPSPEGQPRPRREPSTPKGPASPRRGSLKPSPSPKRILTTLPNIHREVPS